MLRELQSLAANIEHIKEIVASQQNYARTAGVVESIALPDLVDDALEMHKGAIGRHRVKVIREYGETPPILVDKHKVLQILINLLHNCQIRRGRRRAAGQDASRARGKQRRRQRPHLRH